MLIDWFTLAAQIVNFLILVWLLKRFLWGRLIQTIDARENGIRARLAEAEQKNQTADRRAAEIDARAEEQARQRAELLARAEKEAGEFRLEKIQQAREAARNQENQWREDLEREKSAFWEQVRERTAAEILAVVRRILADLSSTELQHSATEAFLAQLQRMDPAKLRDLAALGPLSVLSPSPLAEETRARIRAALDARLGRASGVEFTVSPAMSWGVELRSHGRTIGWTPESYLASLDENLRKVLEVKAKVLAG